VIYALVGPTASGKTFVASALAGGLNAEIVSADSMTIYRGMDIGTAKPSAAVRSRIPHHVIDVADPGERFTVARYQTLARDAIGAIRSRGRAPLVVGGSGLYFRAAVDDLEFPPTDGGVRARFEDEELSRLAVMLKERDPEAAAFVGASNKRRIVRALEVIELTGRPFSSFRDAWERWEDATVAGLGVPRDVLAARIEERLERMLDEGLLDEVRALLEAGFRDGLTSSRAIGYAEAIEMIEGRLDARGFLEEAGRATLKLARRQMAWFRRDPRVRWFDASELERATAEVGAYYEQQQMEGR